MTGILAHSFVPAVGTPAAKTSAFAQSSFGGEAETSVKVISNSPSPSKVDPTATYIVVLDGTHSIFTSVPRV